MTKIPEPTEAQDDKEFRKYMASGIVISPAEAVLVHAKVMNEKATRTRNHSYIRPGRTGKHKL